MFLSAVILTKNEEKNIKRCLKSLDFVDEIIIVDDYSSDKTIEIIKSLSIESKIRIFQRQLNNDFSSQRNYGLEKSRGRWVLFVDADEVITPALKDEMIDVFKKNQDEKVVAYYLKRRDIWWGRELYFGEVKKARIQGIIRLVKKNSGLWQGKVHEVFVLFDNKSKISRLKNYLIHYPHQSLKEFIKEINFYSDLRAKELFENGKKFSIFELVLFPVVKFFLNYFIYLGFLDGSVGFTYAFLMSFHSFLVRAKLYQYQHQNSV